MKAVSSEELVVGDMRTSVGCIALLLGGAAGFVGPHVAASSSRRHHHTLMSAAPKSPSASAAATAAAVVAAFGAAQSASAARSGGRVGGRISGGGGMRGGGYGGGGMRGGGVTNVYMAPPMFSPFGLFSPFSPFGFGFGFGVPFPILVFLLLGLAATSFRSSRGIGGGSSFDSFDEKPGAALCLQVACYCENRNDSLYGKLSGIARTADTNTYVGLQSLVSDTCLAMLRSSKDWLAGRTTSETSGLFAGGDVDAAYNRLVVTERSKWESEQGSLTRTSMGQPTYMVATLVVLLRNSPPLSSVSSVTDLREAISTLASEVSVEGNLLAAEVLWTPEDDNDVMDRDDMFLNFPELVTI